MKRWLHISATLLLVAGCAKAPAPPPVETIPPPPVETPEPAPVNPADRLADDAAARLDRDFHGALAMAREALALQPDHARANLVAGTALQLLDQPLEARAFLERAYEGTNRSLEAGLQLALNRESLGEIPAARTLLEELKARFPESAGIKEAQQRLSTFFGVWPAPGAPGTPAADWKPDHWEHSSELLVGWSKDETRLTALGPDGQVAWELSCGGERILGLFWDEAKRRAIIGTPTQGCMIDAATGRQLATTPTPGGVHWGFIWQGDLLAFSKSIHPAGVPKESPGYFGTDWQVYRMTEAGGKVSLQHLYSAIDGSRTGALSKDGKIFLSWMGNHGAGRPRLFVNGRMVTQYEGLQVGAEFALDPRADRFYFVGYDGQVQARTLDGNLLWQQAGAMHVPLDLWPDEQGRLLIVVKNQEEGFTVYDDQGNRQWSGAGWPAPGDARYLLARQTHETWLMDRQGNVVAKYPRDTFFTADGKALIRKAGHRFLIYRRPQ